MAINKIIDKKKKKALQNLPPGTIVYTGEYKVDIPTIHLIKYGRDVVEEKQITKIEDISDEIVEDRVNWIRITGLHATPLLEKAGAIFGLSSLVLEDIADVRQPPKVEFYEDYIFAVLKILKFDEESKEFKTEHLGLVLIGNIIITFSENEHDTFDSVKSRIRSTIGKIRLRKSDYLFYALFDAVVDRYFIDLDHMTEKLDELDTLVIENPDKNHLDSILRLKKAQVTMMRIIRPIREMINELNKIESRHISKDVSHFLRDLHDHIIQINGDLDSIREMTSSLMDIYMSNISNRMNEVMKVLTIMASIFIPLTFIAGVYGMNFEHMPELGLEWAYPVLLGIMIGISVLLLIFFKKKKWI
ncbi:MAG: magnesium/cobalt transporter CorA [Bacteroidota bacterium]